MENNKYNILDILNGKFVDEFAKLCFREVVSFLEKNKGKETEDIPNETDFLKEDFKLTFSLCVIAKEENVKKSIILPKGLKEKEVFSKFEEEARNYVNGWITEEELLKRIRQQVCLPT
jgi:hypothetical protein